VWASHLATLLTLLTLASLTPMARPAKQLSNTYTFLYTNFAARSQCTVNFFDKPNSVNQTHTMVLTSKQWYAGPRQHVTKTICTVLVGSAVAAMI